MSKLKHNGGYKRTLLILSAIGLLIVVAVVCNRLFNRSLSATTSPAQNAMPMSDYDWAIGDIIQFGRHNWLVLDVQGGRALVITEQIVSRRAYHTYLANITWGNSDIRRWLNDDFYNTFTAEERGRIAEATIINNNNPWYHTRGGANTTDRIFLLSIEEIVQYFGDSGLLTGDSGLLANPNYAKWRWRGFNDDYGPVRSAVDANGNSTWWWLRSPGVGRRLGAVVYNLGAVGVGGTAVDQSGGGVRPALWLNP